MTVPHRGLIPLPYHHMMLANVPRMSAFRRAISLVVGPDDVVVEAGAGTGILSAMAAIRARHVYALELDPALAHTCRQMIANNGLAARVTVVEGPAQDFVPPEKVSVIICEMMHVALANEQQCAVLAALLERLARRQDISALRVIPFAAVNAAQLMEVDYTYEGFHLPLIRTANPYVTDLRLGPVSAPEPYWIVNFLNPEPAIDTVVTLKATRPAVVNAIQVITKAVLTPDLGDPANDWYLFMLQLPIAPRPVLAEESCRVHIAYRAGCDEDQIHVEWIDTH